MLAENGTLYKNGVPFLEDDILVIFEDDADIAINNVIFTYFHIYVCKIFYTFPRL